MKITRRNFLASILAAPIAAAICKEEPKEKVFAKGLFQRIREMENEGLGGYLVPPEFRADLIFEMKRAKLWDYNAPRVRSVFLKNGERYL